MNKFAKTPTPNRGFEELDKPPTGTGTGTAVRVINLRPQTTQPSRANRQTLAGYLARRA